MTRWTAMTQAENANAGWHGFAIVGDAHSCWLCQKPVSAQTLRCPACGALQPLHDPNHFALLGLEERFDLELEDLDRHYASARRTLDPERIAVKNPKAKELAHRYSEMTELAYETLRDPVGRARYLLGLLDAQARAAGQSPADTGDERGWPELDGLAQDIETATDCATVDRLGALAMREVEGCIHTLSTAFRGGRTGEARRALAHLDRLKELATAARRRRNDLCPGPVAGRPSASL